MRKEIANLLGYQNFAEMSIATKMAPSVQAVNEFLENLRDASWLAGRDELLDVQLLAARAGFKELCMPWDYAYWTERLKEERYHLTELKPNFEFPKVLKDSLNSATAFWHNRC